MTEVAQVWFVAGVPGDDYPVLWITKLDAERYARDRFPDEDVDKRYARIFYRSVNKYGD